MKETTKWRTEETKRWSQRTERSLWQVSRVLCVKPKILKHTHTHTHTPQPEQQPAHSEDQSAWLRERNTDVYGSETAEQRPLSADSKENRAPPPPPPPADSEQNSTPCQLILRRTDPPPPQLTLSRTAPPVSTDLHVGSLRLQLGQVVGVVLQFLSQVWVLHL